MLPAYSFNLDQKEIQVLIACMHKAPVPYEMTAPLLHKLQEQVTEQEKAAAEPAQP